MKHSGKLDVLVSKVNCNFRENPLEFSDIHSRRINSGKLVYTYGIKQTSTYSQCGYIWSFRIIIQNKFLFAKNKIAYMFVCIFQQFHKKFIHVLYLT